MESATAAEVVSEMEPAEAADLLSELATGQAADIVEAMAPDDAADVVGGLAETSRESSWTRWIRSRRRPCNDCSPTRRTPPARP